MSVADIAFGKDRGEINQLVPVNSSSIVQSNNNLLPTIDRQPMSQIDLRQTAGGGAPAEPVMIGQPNQIDILFLKRLLFLKATLDN